VEAFGGHVLVPEVLEVVGAAGVEGGLFLVAEAAGYFGDGEVVVAVLGDAGAGALVGEGDVAFFVVVLEPAAAFFLCVGGRDFGVVDHGGECGFVVDAFEAFQVCVGYYYVGVGAALSAAVVVAAAGVGHVAGVKVDVDEGTDDVALAVGGDEGEEWAGAAVGVPDGVVVVVVGLVGLPVGVLAGAVGGHEHDVVHRGVELATL
jgi:hypothetical protein